MVVLKRVLYPTDFSEVSEKALDYVLLLKKAGAEEVVLLHVVEGKEVEAILGAAPWFGKSREEMRKEVERRIKEDRENVLNDIASRLEKEGCRVKKIVAFGNPVKEILRVEEEEDVSIIVMGSHGRTNIMEMLIGSVSEKVVRNAKRPVLVVRR